MNLLFFCLFRYYDRGQSHSYEVRGFRLNHGGGMGFPTKWHWHMLCSTLCANCLVASYFGTIKPIYGLLYQSKILSTKTMLAQRGTAFIFSRVGIVRIDNCIQTSIIAWWVINWSFNWCDLHIKLTWKVSFLHGYEKCMAFCKY